MEYPIAVPRRRGGIIGVVTTCYIERAAMSRAGTVTSRARARIFPKTRSAASRPRLRLGILPSMLRLIEPTRPHSQVESLIGTDRNNERCTKHERYTRNV